MSDGESAQPVRKNRRWMLITLLALLVAGGGGAVAAAAYFYKENVTQIDRRYQTVVVREYVDAVLVRRDDGRASLFACEDQTGLKPILDLRADLVKQEQELKISTFIIIGVMTASGSSVVAEIQIRQQAGTVTTKDLQSWQFNLMQDDGWRVCGAQRLPDPTPSPSEPQSLAPSPVV